MPVTAVLTNAKQEKTICPGQGWTQSGTVSKKKLSKPKEMVWSVRSLSHKNEDLSSRPRTDIKKVRYGSVYHKHTQQMNQSQTIYIKNKKMGMVEGSSRRK